MMWLVRLVRLMRLMRLVRLMRLMRLVRPVPLGVTSAAGPARSRRCHERGLVLSFAHADVPANRPGPV